MSEEKSKSLVELEKTKKKLEVVYVIGVGLVLIGAWMVLFTVTNLDDKMIPDNEHITDQGMPIRDLENATYTWTSEEIEQMAKDKQDSMLVGAFLAVPGAALMYGGLFTIPSQRKMHEVGCKPWDPTSLFKYCPECGYKIADKDKK